MEWLCGVPGCACLGRGVHGSKRETERAVSTPGIPRRRFGLYNVVGAVLWTAVCTGAGYVFGNVPAVQENFSLVVLGIVAVSVLPVLFEVVAAKVGGRRAAGRPGAVRRVGGSLSAGFN